MIVGASKGSATNITIKNSLIQTNGEHGVCIMDFNQGHIQIANCKINENYRDGINLLQTREILVEKSFKHKIENFISDDAVVKLKACEINNNGFYGINIVKFKCVIEKLWLSDNQQGNIMIGEDTKHLVIFLDDNKVDVNLQVGQNCIIKEKGTFCGRNKGKCEIF